MKPRGCPDVLTHGDSSTVPSHSWMIFTRLNTIFTDLSPVFTDIRNVFVMQPNLKFLAYRSILFIMWLFIIICFILIQFNSEWLYKDHYIFWLPSKAKYILETNLGQKALFCRWGHGGTEKLNNTALRHPANQWKIRSRIQVLWAPTPYCFLCLAASIHERMKG